MHDARHATIDMPPSCPSWYPPEDQPPSYEFATQVQQQQYPPAANVQGQQQHPLPVYVQQQPQVFIVPVPTPTAYGREGCSTVRGSVATVSQPVNAPGPVTNHAATTEPPYCQKLMALIIFTILLLAISAIARAVRAGRRQL